MPKPSTGGLLFATLLCVVTGVAAQSVSNTLPKIEDAYAAKLSAKRPIDARQSYWLEELTWMEVRDLVAAGHTTVIIPTGGVEENGPYLATGKHNVILEASCPAIARLLGNALCAPIVKFVPEGDIDPPTKAMRFPGSISLSASTYEALLTDIAMSLKQSGFTNIVMIGDSGGNQKGMQTVAAKLNESWAEQPVRVHFIKAFYKPGWEATENFTRTELGVEQTRKDGYHDDIWVTAMMMVTDPAQVRFEERVRADRASINGVPITPLEDTVALGQQMIEFRAALTVDAIISAIAGQ
ncbi:creatininase family protein [Congregibacter variabilis]|uniref:Creatininase family protein n=1 Tax=Congregibacter variabilis TaxID=3081200 RepID=A0ABZ0I558_9GAMM|nr:creatininase family protein [Congregibacter sp. IMCC43200]